MNEEIADYISATTMLAVSLAAAMSEQAMLKGVRANEAAREIRRLAAILDRARSPDEPPSERASQFHSIAQLLEGRS